MPMKIAITGGAGFIGTHLAKAYLEAGHDVLIIDSLVHGSRHALDSRARFYQVDIRESNIHTILQQERPDIVSHHAAQRPHMLIGEQSLLDADVHVRGLLNILDACVNASIPKFIYISGGNNLYRPMDAEYRLVTENAPFYPRSPHAISKVAGEWYVRYYTEHYGLKHTIFRYANVYGETPEIYAMYPHHDLSYYICMLAENRQPIIRGSGNEMQDHIFIDDVVRANLCALQRGENQTLHISSGSSYTLNQLFQAVAQQLRSNLQPIYLHRTCLAIEPTGVVLDNTRALHALGWQPEIALREGVALAVARLTKREEPGNAARLLMTARNAEAGEAALMRA
ncbi:MAG TPA: NAD-dependent epimerase/dehydratase family protein [Ktedonobacteraceae bacterium]|nr:NAD-dependent epimerase/dehydratase family protein [Ktedonobacteraceae bacterium]